ncbi:unnamed protein product, partial [Leptidea sinapis]
SITDPLLFRKISLNGVSFTILGLLALAKDVDRLLVVGKIYYGGGGAIIRSRGCRSRRRFDRSQEHGGYVLLWPHARLFLQGLRRRAARERTQQNESSEGDHRCHYQYYGSCLEACPQAGPRRHVYKQE